MDRSGFNTTIVFRNRDKLPPAFGVLGGVYEVGDKARRDGVERARQRLSSAERAQDSRLSDAAVRREYERVIVADGLQALSEYLGSKRSALVEETRRVVWRMMVEPESPSFESARRAMLAPDAKLDERKVPRSTHVFVDEVQDFGPAEIRLLASMTSPVRHRLRRWRPGAIRAPRPSIQPSQPWAARLE